MALNQRDAEEEAARTVHIRGPGWYDGERFPFPPLLHCTLLPSFFMTFDYVFSTVSIPYSDRAGLKEMLGVYGSVKHVTINNLLSVQLSFISFIHSCSLLFFLLFFPSQYPTLYSDMTEAGLKKMLGVYGSVKHVTINPVRRYAFVVFDDSTAATAAVDALGLGVVGSVSGDGGGSEKNPNCAFRLKRATVRTPINPRGKKEAAQATSATLAAEILAELAAAAAATNAAAAATGDAGMQACIVDAQLYALMKVRKAALTKSTAGDGVVLKDLANVLDAAASKKVVVVTECKCIGSCATGVGSSNAMLDVALTVAADGAASVAILTAELKATTIFWVTAVTESQDTRRRAVYATHIPTGRKLMLVLRCSTPPDGVSSAQQVASQPA